MYKRQAYNTAVVHVNETYVHTTYANQSVVQAGIVANPNHVAYNGGPGGIQHAPTAAEQVAAHESHTAPTSAQTHLAATAQADRSSFAKANGGHPANVAVARPQVAAPAAKVAPKAEVQQHLSLIHIWRKTI